MDDVAKSLPRELLEAVGELALAIAPHHMDIGQRQRIAAAMSTLVDHIIHIAERTSDDR